MLLTCENDLFSIDILSHTMFKFLYNMDVATVNRVELRFHYDKNSSAAMYSHHNIATCVPKT